MTNPNPAVGDILNAAHTPGPWMVAAKPSSIVGWPVVAQTGQSICNLSWLGHKPPDVNEKAFAAYRAMVEANGRLIAAAPDMLAAGREIDRLMLVIESAVRTADPRNHAAVLAALKANRASLSRAEPQS